MRLILTALLLLTACSADLAPPQPSRPSQPVDAAPAVTLAGEWRIAGIDGKPFDEPHGLTLSADAEEVWWAPRCAGLIRTYRINGIRIRIGLPQGLRPGAPGEPATAVCAIGLPPRLDEVTRALDSATTIRRTPNNGIEISGGGRSLLLFSQ